MKNVWPHFWPTETMQKGSYNKFYASAESFVGILRIDYSIKSILLKGAGSMNLIINLTMQESLVKFYLIWNTTNQ